MSRPTHTRNPEAVLVEHGIRPNERRMTSDLECVATPASLAFAGRLNSALKTASFDTLNSVFRSDHSNSPIPFLSVDRLRKDFRQARSRAILPGEVTLMECLLLGEAVSRISLSEGFGPGGPAIIKDGLTAGIFIEDPNGRIRTANLLLCSHKLGDGNIVYAFTDIPPYIPSSGSNLLRVYLGGDSYFLNAKLQTLVGIDGCVVEYGSGSGIQLQTLLQLNLGITKAIGLEIDARARNLSRFNAALNLVGDRFEVAEDEAALLSLLGGAEIRLALSNPPFVAAPYNVEIPGSRTSLDLSLIFNRTGWGGDDGLFHTSRFLAMVTPRMSPTCGQVIVYSQFVGDESGPTAIMQRAAGMPFPRVTFEMFPKGESTINYNLGIDSWANYITTVLKRDFPCVDGVVLGAVKGEVISMFRRQGVTKLHSGFVTLAMEGAPANDAVALHRAEEALGLEMVGILPSGLSLLLQQDSEGAET